MNVFFILVLVIVLVGVTGGYGPHFYAGSSGVIAIILVVLFLSGRI